MIHGDICHNRNKGGDNIGGIQAATKSSFQNNKIKVFFGKPEKSDGSGKFKVGYFLFTKDIANCGGNPGKAFFTDKCLTNAKPFTHRTEMGGSIEANPISSPGKKRQQGNTHRTFTVGSGYMNNFQFRFGVVHTRHKGAHGIKTKLDFMKLQTVEIIPGLLVVHVSLYKSKFCVIEV